MRDARFDPLSIAAADQQLYNQLHAWLADSARPKEFSVDVDLRGSLRRADLSIDALISKVSQRYRMLDRFTDGTVVLLSHRAARLPGLAEHVASNAARVISLDRMDLFRGIATHQSLIRSDPSALRLVTRLPVQSAPRSGARSSAAAHGVATAARAPHTRSVGQRRGGDRAESDVRPRGVSRSCRSISRATRCRSSPEAAACSCGSPTARAALLDGDVAQNGATIAKGAVLEVAGARFQLIRTRSGP